MDAQPINTQTKKHSALEVFKTFLILGFTSFGGPAAHIGFFRQAFVVEKKWFSEQQFSQLLALCQFVPGPASSQLGMLLGLFRAGWAGAAAAFFAFTLPSAVFLFGLATVLPHLDSTYADPVIHGLKLIAVAVVAHAVWGMAKQFCTSWWHQLIAIISLIVMLFSAHASMQLIIIAVAASIGFFLPSFAPKNDFKPLTAPYSTGLGVIFLIVFAALLAITLSVSINPQWDILAGVYQAGALVFGGGHVVLPLLDDVLVTPGWVTADEFMAGYGATQSVPGPLFTVTAYLGALLPDGMGGMQGAVLCLLALFIPGFLLVLGVIPIWTGLMKKRRASQIVGSVNAAVVGLLAAALYDPIIVSGITVWTDIVIVLISLIMLFRKFSVLWVILWSLVSVLLITFL